MAEPLGKSRFVHRTRPRERAIAIDGNARVAQCPVVDSGVTRAGIEGEDLFGLGCGRNDGDIGDAAEIESDAAELGVTPDQIVTVASPHGSVELRARVETSLPAGVARVPRGQVDEPAGVLLNSDAWVQVKVTPRTA